MIRRSLFAAAAALAMLAGSPQRAAADTYVRQPGIDALEYSFRITLTDESDEITAEAKAVLKFVSEGLQEFSLDLASVNDGGGMTVSQVTTGEASATVKFVHEADRLRIIPPNPPKVGETQQFTIRYHGIPAAGLRIGTNRHQERTFFSLNWPDKARQWLPIIDHPYDKAASEFIITAPVKYQVVANGLLIEETDIGDGRRRTHWKQSAPIASWLNAIGVAQFASHHAGTVRGIPLQTWVYRQERDAGIATFEEPARQAIEFFSDFIGPYPYEKLANIQAAGLSGGTEHASAIFYGESSVTGRPATSLVAHEIAHQWFGDSVTERDWDDVWLSEGFATYFALLFTEHSQGREAFVAAVKRSRDQVLAAQRRSPGLPVIHENLADMRRVLNQLVYQKGGWTLHMLRGIVGPEKFQAGIREYYTRYRDANASTDEFRAVMEQASGMELRWFFDQWLKRPGVPVVAGTWRYDLQNQRVEIELTQTQQADAYRLPLEVGVSSTEASPPRIQKIEMTQRTQRFEIPADVEPASIMLDPNTWVLMEARLEKK